MNIRRNSAVSIHIFNQILDNILEKMLKLLSVVLMILSPKIEEGC